MVAISELTSSGTALFSSDMGTPFNESLSALIRAAADQRAGLDTAAKAAPFFRTPGRKAYLATCIPSYLGVLI
jgi:hypothetical protein